MGARSHLRTFVSHRLFFVVMVVLLVVVGTAYGREYVRDRQIRRDIEAFKEQEALLIAENAALAAFRDYVETQSFYEKEAREKFGKSRPGETVVYVNESMERPQQTAEDQRQPSTVRLWTWYFFSPDDWYAAVGTASGT